MPELVILVSPDDTPIGVEAKLRAHEDGSLHRAVSVFVFDRRGAMLLQRRARGKYHSGGLWSNAACGHPRPDEPTLGAARRRLREEMGIECALRPAFRFTYRAELGGGMREHEVDHVFVGRCEAVPAPDPAEVEAWRWASVAEVRAELGHHPERFTVWFELALDEMIARGAHEAA